MNTNLLLTELIKQQLDTCYLKEGFAKERFLHETAREQRSRGRTGWKRLQIPLRIFLVWTGLPKCSEIVGVVNQSSFTYPKSSFPKSARLVDKMLGHLVGVFSDPLGHPIVHMESKYYFW